MFYFWYIAKVQKWEHLFKEVLLIYKSILINKRVSNFAFVF